MPGRQLLARLIGATSGAEPHETKAALLAFLCNFVLLASYAVLPFGVAGLAMLAIAISAIWFPIA